MTPEGKVKAKVKKLLKKFEPSVWGDWPVPAGYGKSTVDYIGCNMGRFFAIETKAHGKHPTPLQALCLQEIERKGGKTFVIGSNGGVDDPAFGELEEWLAS
jgi:hypothetical protein